MTDENGVSFEIETEEIESQSETDDVIKFINYRIFEFIEKLT